MTALVLHQRVLDFGLEVLDDEATHIYVCSAQPTTFSEATTGGTYALGNKNFGAGAVFASPAAGDPTGRQVTSNEITDGDVTNDGTVSHWAVTDNTNSRLLATGELTGGIAVTADQTFTLEAFTIKMVGSGYQGPGDVVSTGLFAFWGIRAVNAAAIGTNLVRLKDATNANESDFAAQDDGGLDEAAITSWLSGHTGVGHVLYDQVGSADATDFGGDGNLPIWLNNNGGFQFDNSHQWEYFQATFSSPGSQPYTFIAVVKNTNLTSGSYILAHFAGGDGIILAANGDDQLSLYGGATLAQSATDDADHAVVFVLNAGSSVVRVDGAEGSGDAGSRNFGGSETMRLGGDGVAGHTWGGTIREFGIWTGAFDATQRANMIANMRAFYGF